MENIKDLVIIGSGPAGLSAAVYASRAMIDVYKRQAYGTMLETAWESGWLPD